MITKALLSVLIMGAGILSYAQKPVQVLSLGGKIERSISNAEKHLYTLSLAQDQYSFAMLHQQGVDLIITAFDPQGNQLEEFDSPNGQNGPEAIALTSKLAGDYRLEVRPLNDQQPDGRYTLEVLKIEPVAATLTGKVDQLFTAWDRPDSPGASIAVVQNGSVIYTKGYGRANLEYDIPNSPSTVFHIASVSKQFTAFAIASLADQGRLSLDDDIRKYLSELPDFGQTITIRHLVHHTSGLRDQWNLLAMAGWRLDDVITEEHIMKLLYRQKELNFDPGEKFLYCNSGYTLMAKIVEAVTGKTFREWTAENIFKPLGMDHTLFYDDHQEVVKNRAYSYQQSKAGYEKRVLSYANVGATSLFTTVEDLSKWAVNFEEMTVGNQDIFAQMEERGILNTGDTISYAFGQGINSYKGLPVIAHGGADAGYRTYFARFPEQRFSVIVLSNLGAFDPGGMGYKIADLYLAGQLRQEPAKAEKIIPADTLESIPVDREILEAYTGRYELAPNFVLNVSLENGQLFLQATGQSKLEMIARSDTEFFLPEASGTARVNFQRNNNGKVHELILSQGGRDRPAPKLKAFDSEAVDLASFTGRYYSEELETVYTLTMEGKELIAGHQRNEDFKLTPIKEDTFRSDRWFFRNIEFVRDEQQSIKGFKASGGRVQNLWFERVE